MPAREPIGHWDCRRCRKACLAPSWRRRRRRAPQPLLDTSYAQLSASAWGPRPKRSCNSSHRSPVWLSRRRPKITPNAVFPPRRLNTDLAQPIRSAVTRGGGGGGVLFRTSAGFRGDCAAALPPEKGRLRACPTGNANRGACHAMHAPPPQRDSHGWCGSAAPELPQPIGWRSPRRDCGGRSIDRGGPLAVCCRSAHWGVGGGASHPL